MAELHPMVVHLPIGVVLLYPFFELAAALTRRRELGAVSLALLGVAVISSLVASTTGEAAYDAAVTAGYDHALLGEHEEWAEMLPWALIAVFAARLYLAFETRFGPWVGVALGAALVAFVVQVGNSGGWLVYEHGVGVRPGAGPAASSEDAPATVYEDEEAEDVAGPHD